MTYLAVALAAQTTAAAQAALRQIAGRADLAELRLDLMHEFDLPALLAARPLPVIVTCRPPREGGRWQGNEAARLAVLQQAAALGAEYVDVEWDAAAMLPNLDRTHTRVILSRHHFNTMPVDLAQQAAALAQAGADVVKVVGMAHSLTDCARALRVLDEAPLPTIAIAMGVYGLPSRVLAFRSPRALLSFATPDAAAGTAPGQLTLTTMLEDLRVRALTPQTTVIGWADGDVRACGAANARLAAQGLDAVTIPLLSVGDTDRAQAAASLRLAFVLPAGEAGAVALARWAATQA
ncbi:MAG: type I 3-dehydroquinate dehydratase [Anaerolineae bacterium]